MKTYQQMVNLFEQANEWMILQDLDLFRTGVNERSLCGALMLHMHDLIKNDASFDGYYTDVEYNRNRGRIKNSGKNCYRLWREGNPH